MLKGIKWGFAALLLSLTLVVGTAEAHAVSNMFAEVQTFGQESLPRATWYRQPGQSVPRLFTESNHANAGLVFDLGDPVHGKDVDQIAFSYHRHKRNTVYPDTTHPCLRIEAISDKGQKQIHTIYIPQMHNYNAGNGWRNCLLDLRGKSIKGVTRVALVVARANGLVAPDFGDCSITNFTVNGKPADSVSFDVSKEVASGKGLLQYPNLRYAKP